MGKKLHVLFLCTGNSCRSQMAEGWARHLKGDSIEAYSAGIEPHGLNLHAVQVMKEVGVDISKYKSKHIDQLHNINIDIVITVCGHAHETCPIFPHHTQVVHIGFDDPPEMARKIAMLGGSQEEQLNCYRNIRDQIKFFITKLPEILNT